jgi:isopenicillin-N N-acyltransferase-like protein
MFLCGLSASCSFLGAWGSAVKVPGNAFQLRALDYDTVGPFKDFPQVTIYHPSEGNGWSQVGWPGNLGVLTGFSEQQLAISEIGVSYPDESFGQGMVPDTPPEKVHGEPWMFILRDVLQYESTLDAGLSRIQNANRTCNLIIGLGGGKEAHSYGIEYSGYVAIPYDDKNQLPVNETWHPVVTDAVYNGMDWLCPNFDTVLGAQLQKYHGTIDESVIIGNILPTVQTGNLHIAVYDLVNSNMHVSFSRPAAGDVSEPEYAYERQFTRLHMNTLFAETAPNL